MIKTAHRRSTWPKTPQRWFLTYRLPLTPHFGTQPKGGQVKAPVLLIHGEADDNQGTFPIQSERMYQAIRGNGGTVRPVFLPAEAHGYQAKETIEHVLWEMITWFDKYVKNAGKAPTGAP